MKIVRSYVLIHFSGGGYVISPMNKSKQSAVKHMLDIDWKHWRSYLKRYSDQSLSIHMIGRLAGLLFHMTIVFMLFA